MQLEGLMGNVSKVRDNANYWMIRTESGFYFETFLENDFVAIGWNAVTVADIKNPTKEDRVRNIISTLEQLDPTTPRGKGSITTIYNKIQNFIELKKGDIVIIPGPSSHELAFGLIEDHQVYVENDQLCEHRKRRKVKWLEKKEKTKLDPIFYKMKVSRHALTNLDLYSNYIDAVINTVFIKENHAHFVIDFKKVGDINIDTLLGLMTNLRELSIKINEAFEFGDPMEYQSIRCT